MLGGVWKGRFSLPAPSLQLAMTRMCEGCGAKRASFGTPTERKARWCGGCGKARGAINLAAKMCEGCGAKQATFGTPTERKKRWCGGCGKAHGAIQVNVTMCEGCGAKQANFGTATERKKRWCSGCGKAHGTIHLNAKMCEGCGAKQAGYGTATERKRRWCGGCGKAHGAIIVTHRGAKRMRLDPPANLSTSGSTTPGADPVADGDRAHEGMASGDATSLLAVLTTVKQELPADATRQYATPESMYRSMALPPPHQQPAQGLQVDLLVPGALGIVCQESWRDGLVSEVRVEYVAPGSFAESKGVRVGMSLESVLHYAPAANLSGTAAVVAQRIDLPMQTLRFAGLLDLIRFQRPLSLRFAGSADVGTGWL